MWLLPMYLRQGAASYKFDFKFGYFHVCDILYVLLFLDTIKLPPIQEAETLQSDMYGKTKWSSLRVTRNAKL